MSRYAMLLSAAWLAAACAGVAQAQTSPSGINSSSPGSPPLTGPSVSPGGVPSQPAPFNSGVGASSGALDTSPPASSLPSQPVPFNSPTGSVQDNAVQMELARCNAMVGGSREICVDNLRSRMDSGIGARSGGGSLSSPGASGTTGAGSNSGAGSVLNPVTRPTLPGPATN